MQRRRVILVLFGCVVAAIVIAFVWPWEREPRYKGVTLTAWLCSYDSGPANGSSRSIQDKEEAASAVRHVGTNSIPFLLQWMCDEPASWRRQWRNAFRKLPHPVDRLGRLSDRVYGLKWPLRNRLALEGFEILGPDAAAAIPELTRIMSNAKSSRLQFAAAQTLGSIGRDGLEPLVLALGDKPGDWRHHAILLMVIGRMDERGLDITAAVPALLQSVGDPDLTVSSFAWTTLEQLSVEKSPFYLPLLAANLRHSNEVVRASAATILVSVATNVQPRVLKEATNVLSAARPELVERLKRSADFDQ